VLHDLAADQVQVEVGYFLPSMGASIQDQAVAVLGDAFLRGDSFNC
jgi:hypothetical protein